MTFGLLDTGFAPKRLADCLSDYQALFRQKLGSNIDLRSSEPPGQLVGILAEREALLWELLDQIYQASFQNGATGMSLDQLYALVNLPRFPASVTRVTVTCKSTTGSLSPVSLPAGQLLKTTSSGSIFASVAAASIPSGGGTVDVVFESQDTGPIPALAGTLSIIQTPVTGWLSATNAADGALGRDIETDAAYRVRRQKALVSILASSAPAVVAAILRIPDVIEVKDIQNLTAFPDIDGRPPKSYELVIRGGDEATIRGIVYVVQPSGIETVGNVTGTVTDLHGDAQPVNFSRPDTVNVYITVDLTVDASFPSNGLDLVAATILDYGQNHLSIGETVAPFKIEQLIETPGIVVCDMKLGRLISPTDSAPLPMGSVELGVFDSSRLIVRKA